MDFSTVRVVDADSHLQEPPDLWTSRLPAKWRDRGPTVRWDPVFEDEAWFMGDQKLLSVGATGQAGWSEFPPKHPPRFSDINPAAWDANRRLQWMDENGIWAQVLYSNVGLFHLAAHQQHDPSLVLELIRIYNDYQTEWSSAAPDRLLPMTQLPFWDLGATLLEIERCAVLGHKGVVFSQDPAAYGFPRLDDEYWDPMWARLQEMGLCVNFHVGSARTADDQVRKDKIRHEDVVENIWEGCVSTTSNLKTIARLILHGVCHRFPTLNFVSVESGVGWIPFLLAQMDWQWKNFGAARVHPEFDLMPSEYFRRQILACFWFETSSAVAAIEQLGADNVLFETDFPHPTSMSPGPASTAVKPIDFLETNFAHLDDVTLGKVLHDNAARIYGLEMSS